MQQLKPATADRKMETIALKNSLVVLTKAMFTFVNDQQFYAFVIIQSQKWEHIHQKRTKMLIVLFVIAPSWK